MERDETATADLRADAERLIGESVGRDGPGVVASTTVTRECAERMGWSLVTSRPTTPEQEAAIDGRAREELGRPRGKGKERKRKDDASRQHDPRVIRRIEASP